MVNQLFYFLHLEMPNDQEQNNQLLQRYQRYAEEEEYEIVMDIDGLSSDSDDEFDTLDGL